jgi:cyclopropane-fatty-acyl-phospholipid synthase
VTLSEDPRFVLSASSPVYGGSARAIRHHYDVGRNFYALWLDETMTYSCALWQEGDDLAKAQLRKIDYHLSQSRAERARSILDIGCGWGGLMRSAVGYPSVENVVGLTLSEDQADFVGALALDKAHVRLESWTEHEPECRYDSIVSIGAFEHFAGADDSPARKVATYRDFFERCRAWLTPGGRMSLQTIAFGSMRREEASPFISKEIFPESDLPRLEEIAAAADGILEITRVRNDRLDYARTVAAWAQRLRATRTEALALVGADVVGRYERYLKQTSMGFYVGKLALYRVSLRPISDRWPAMAID